MDLRKIFNILWNNALEDKLNIFKTSNFKDFKKTKMSQTDREALQAMELKEDVKWEKIHSKFKELVKKYHLIKIKVINNSRINLKKLLWHIVNLKKL